MNVIRKLDNISVYLKDAIKDKEFYIKIGTTYDVNVYYDFVSQDIFRFNYEVNKIAVEEDIEGIIYDIDLDNLRYQMYKLPIDPFFVDTHIKSLNIELESVQEESEEEEIIELLLDVPINVLCALFEIEDEIQETVIETILEDNYYQDIRVILEDYNRID